eukprot:242332_1
MGNEFSNVKKTQQNVTMKAPTNECASTICDSEIDTISTLSRNMAPVTNGVIHEYLSQRLALTAASFWLGYIEPLSMEDKLEIGCSIFYGMISANTAIKKIMHESNLSKFKLEMQSLKFLDMVGWLIRNLSRDGIDLFSMLQKLGKIHEQMGIKMDHFDIMVKSLHETMIHYFPKQYNIQTQYSMEQILLLSAHIMIQTNFTRVRRKTRLAFFRGSNTPCLESLEKCLLSNIGSEYFFRYLINNYCEELVIYLKCIQKFKNAISDKERYNIAIDLMETCIFPNSRFAINISYETRNSLLVNFEVLKKNKSVSSNYFSDVEMEIRRLIIKNHWKRFVRSITVLHNSAISDLINTVTL